MMQQLISKTALSPRNTCICIPHRLPSQYTCLVFYFLFLPIGGDGSYFGDIPVFHEEHPSTPYNIFHCVNFQYRQKNFQRLRRKPGITTIRKKAQLTRVKTLMNFPPLPGYSRT